ncbi:hypothetical protein QTP88_010904 [Uroleucon formosanum]
MWIDNEEPDGSKNTLPNLFLLMLLINKIFNLGGAGHSLGDETCINYNTYDSDDRRQPTTIDEECTGEMWSSNSETLENTINSRKRYQNQNEGLNDNKQYLFKKIKIEDNNDESFLETLKRLECNSSNFNDWVDLLKIVDSQYNEEHARMAYSTFLNMYPLCYGYWKKYANFEKINSNMHEFEIVLENGLSAIPISVDLWIYYMTYLRTERYNETSHIRNEFERSLQFCGLDYHSDQLWYDYISWELLMNEPLNVIKIYHRLICIPTLNYLKNFFKFQEFIFNCLPVYYLEPDDYEQRQKRIIKSLETNRSNKLSNNDSMPPGEEFQQRTLIVEDHVIFLMKIEIINEWHFFHKQTAKEFERRVIFEENIRRPHFHVNELDSAQIKNWENYIKFERRAGNHERIIHLYERCLITCVSNEYFWLNYLEYLCFVNIDVAALLINVFERSLFHHPMSLLLNLKYFDYCETQGWVETAEKTIRKLETIYPDSREVSIKLINLARKCKDDKLEMSFKHYLNISQSKSFSSYIAQENEIDNIEFDIIDDTDQIPEDQISTDETLEEENRIDNNEAGQIDESDQIPEDQISTDETSEQENEIDNKESDKSSAILSIKKEMWIDNEEPDGSKNTLPNLFLLMLLINKIFNLGGAGHSLGDETCINYNTYDSDDRRQPTTIDEERTGEMWSSNSETLENTINSRKRYQNQNEGLNDNKQYLFKKIKIEDNNDESFLETLKRLECNSSNFNDWVDLLKIVDSQYNEEHARMAYSTFLNLYPLCYGYWKKYANFEKINSNMHEFEIVLENGLSAIPISVDLWIYYMTYLRTERYNETSHIRNEFERSLQFCGLDYHSDQLWYDYISWELLMNEPLNVIKIYHRLICIPTLNYLKNFFKFQEFIFNCLPVYYLEPDDYEQRQKRIIKSLETNRSNKLSNNDSMPPGEEFQQRTLIVEDHVIFLMKIEIINEWHFFHKQTAKEFERRVIFEENIRRPHFHVNELDSAQIKNWENYIKFERRAGNHERIIHLYERCLITCVSNEYFWLNYLEYLCFVNIDVAALLINVFERSLFHHPMSLLLNLKYFDYCETQGWVETAEKTIRKLETIYPDSREVSIKLINLARKCKDDKLEMSFKHYLNISQSKSFSSYIAVRYARFVWKHDRQLNLAFDILYDTIIKNNITVNDSLDIYLTLVELKMELNPKDHLSVLKTIDDIILQCNLYREKLVFSKKKSRIH